MLAMIMAIEDDEDRSFVSSIYTSYHSKMYRLALDILKNDKDAEDCVQDTFIKIIDKLGRFKQANKENYLIKLIVVTCRNTAINKYRKKQAQRQKEFSFTAEDGTEEFDVTDYTADVEKIVLSEYLCTYVKELIDQLDLKYRDVLVLKSLGYNYEDIAHLMNISEALVRKRYSRAKRMLIDMGGEALYEFRDR